ncbi:MAG: hypothetical protein GY829_04750 [Gammaproteobacteria bacterium]|nr:hypothetical protein [Gammaproteobacteria bacterium]
MKKTALYTAMASSLLLASGTLLAEDTNESTGWDYKGQAVVYYQTADGYGRGGLFDQGPSDTNSGWAAAAAGLQLTATNKDITNGFGVGLQLSGLSSLGLEEDIVSGMVQNAGSLNDAAITQAYVTYAANKTSVKYGRQELPKSLSPFAFTEGWNAFKNTFEALLVVNSDIKDTTLVFASVSEHNNSVGSLNDFSDFHSAKGPAYMVTAQNKSIKGVTLTGSYYAIPDAVSSAGSYVTDAEAFWLDAGFKVGKANIGLQGGYIGGLSLTGTSDTKAFGAKISGKIDKFSYSFAFSSADDGTLNIANLAGAGVKTPLYTQGALNQNVIKRDSDSFKATISMSAMGGKFIGSFLTSDMGDTALSSTFGLGVSGSGTYNEYDFIYKKSLTKNIPIFAAFIIQQDDRQGSDDYQNFFRVWARYNF